MINTKVIDISKWSILPTSPVPIGKRVKNTIINPKDNVVYYFKEPESRYPWEHWTEIAASKIGQTFKFNVLDYNIGVLDDRVGCISQSMISSHDELIHGQQLLTQIKPKFEKKKGTDHTFQLILEVFQDVKLKHLLGDFLKMLVFDSIIGNRDRHQQNWGFIRSVKVSMKNDKLDAKVFNFKKRGFWNFILSLFKDSTPLTEIINNISIEEVYQLTPYFDNGNCLAYNITNDSLELFLNDKQKLNNYLFGKKATSHIKWENNSVSHYELLGKIITIYPNGVKEIIEECIDGYSEEDVNSIIMNLDIDFDSDRHKSNVITLQRKELMCELVRMRIEKLKELIG